MIRPYNLVYLQNKFEMHLVYIFTITEKKLNKSSLIMESKDYLLTECGHS